VPNIRVYKASLTDSPFSFVECIMRQIKKRILDNIIVDDPNRFWSGIPAISFIHKVRRPVESTSGAIIHVIREEANNAYR